MFVTFKSSKGSVWFKEEELGILAMSYLLPQAGLFSVKKSSHLKGALGKPPRLQISLPYIDIPPWKYPQPVFNVFALVLLGKKPYLASSCICL